MNVCAEKYVIQSMRYENLTIDLYHNVMSRNIPHGHWIFNFILCYLISHNVHVFCGYG